MRLYASDRQAARWATLALCAASMCLGAMVLAGWVLNLEPLKRLLGGTVAMPRNAAGGTILSSMALGALVWFRFTPAIRAVVTLVGVLIVVFSVFTLGQGVTGWHLSLQPVLGVTGAQDTGSLAARLSLGGALSSALIGLALVTAARSPQRVERLATLAALASTEVLISGLSVLSHLLNRYLDMEVWRFSPPALESAVALLLIGLALLSTLYSEGGLRWATDRLTTSGFLAGMLSLLLAAGLTYYFTWQLQQNAGIVSQTQAVMDLVDQIRTDVAEGAGLVRGYVITGDERLASRRDEIFVASMRSLSALRAHLEASPEDQLAVDELVRMLENRRRLSGILVETRRQRGFEAAQKMVMARDGLAQTDDFVQTINALRAAQNTRLDQFEQRSNQFTQKTFLTLPLGAAIGLTLLLLALFKLNDGTAARQRTEKHNQRLTNFYAALSQTNQAVVHVNDAATLYRDICRICVKYGHAKVAIISFVKGDYVQPEVFSGPAEAYIDGLVLPLDATLPDGNSFIAQAVRGGQTQICHDFFSDPQTLPWRERVKYLDTRSLAVFPFRRSGVVMGTLSLQMPERDFFTPELISLLEEMMGDLSFALDNMDRDAARTLAEAALRDSEQRIRSLFEQAADGIFVLTDDQHYLEANPAGLAMLGYSLDELLQMSIKEVLAEEELPRLASRMPSTPSTLRRVEEWKHRRKDGTSFVAEVSTSALPDQRFMAIIRDVTGRKQAEARIEYLANHDALTGLPNRTLMRDRITQAISHAKRGGRQLALMYLDLDRFKVINDGYGHPFGDLLLKATGERLLQAVREGDTVARQSGDEFLILLADLRKFSDAYIVCQKVLDAFAQPFLLGDREIYITLSIGVSVFPQNGEGADELISHADVAMYRSKELGRSTYQFFTEEMSVATQQQVDLETRLRMAIAHNELHLVYQPKVDLHTGRILGCEALLRWNHPELGSVSPARFIPIAEESGLIVLIGDWVLRTACKQGKAWLDAGLPPVVMSVNLSARQFLQQDVVRWVFGALESTQLAPELLELELTESLIAQDTEKVIATVVQLKAAGVKLSIDDFGTGYSSLSYLRRFRVDTLKIDQSFIRDMLKDAEDAAIPLAVISMAHSLRLKVIAEGVETVEQCNFLRDNGCDEIQGYFFSKPVPAAEFEHMLRSDKRLPSRDVSR